MKALTLWQPWASLVAFGHKQVETRCWQTKYRGPIAIHAAKNIPSFLGKSRLSDTFEAFYEQTGLPPYRELPTGVIVCIADIESIEETEDVRAVLSPKELTFGNYEDGRYAWNLYNISRLLEPIAAKGHQQLWNWEETSCLKST